MQEKLLIINARFALSFILLVYSLVPIQVSALTIDPHEMRGLRTGPLLLDFSAVKFPTEDRTLIHFSLDGYSGDTTGATLNLGINNIDQGSPAGTIDVYSFAGDGVTSPDEWGAGTLYHTFTGIGGGYDTLSVDIAVLLSSALLAGDDYLSFNLRTVDSDRYWLNSTIDGVTSSISGEGPTYIDAPSLVPVPAAGWLFVSALLVMGSIKSRRAG